MSRIGLGRHSRLDDAAGDPLDGLVNLFDVGIVLAVAFLVAGLSLTRDPRSGRIERGAGGPAAGDSPSPRTSRQRPRERTRRCGRHGLPPGGRSAGLRRAPLSGEPYPPIGARGFAPQKSCVPSMPMRCT